MFARVPLLCAALLCAPAAAQGSPEEGRAPVYVQTPAEALAQDAGEYARFNDVPPAEAVRRLRAIADSVAFTDDLQARFADRLAGVSIEHRPALRIVVVLVGDRPVRDRFVSVGETVVPVVFRTGARATRAQLADAIVTHREAIGDFVPGAQGMGVDLRTGELVVLVAEDVRVDRGLDEELEGVTGVPVRVRPAGRVRDTRVDGGARLTGVDPADGRSYVCTTGFSVTDGERAGLVTAAHCPDRASYHDPDTGSRTPLDFVGQWGVGHQDVQVHVAREGAPPLDAAPFFYADTAKRLRRPVSGARARTSVRAGDPVCHRGEASGYGCSEVDLVDFAPPGALCAGPCDPLWTTVAGPSCRGGDSGGPIFIGTTALGITKGGSYDNAGRCRFSFYMAIDYLPDGWSLLVAQADATPVAGSPWRNRPSIRHSPAAPTESRSPSESGE